MRRAFTLLELLLVIGVLSVGAAFTVPMYRNYQVRNDLDLTATQVLQALGRAQIRSQSGEKGSMWGFHVPSGTLFQGATYLSRDPIADELYQFPSTIETSGLVEVSFATITGNPSATGSIVLEALTRDRRTIDIVITREGIATNISDRLTVCHMQGGSCTTKLINDNAWRGHQRHGDFLGICRDMNRDGDLCD